MVRAPMMFSLQVFIGFGSGLGKYGAEGFLRLLPKGRVELAGRGARGVD